MVIQLLKCDKCGKDYTMGGCRTVTIEEEDYDYCESCIEKIKPKKKKSKVIRVQEGDD